MTTKEQQQLQLKEIEAMVAQIHPVMQGHHPVIQGAVLLELMMTWLSGHYPHAVRYDLLAEHCKQLQKFIDMTDPMQPPKRSH